MSAATSPAGTAFVRAVVELGAGLGMRVVAEGVETPAQADAARQLGCELAQGYLWGAAAPTEHITRLLQSGCLAGVEPAGERQGSAVC